MKLLITDDQVSVHKYLDKVMNWKNVGIDVVMNAFNGKEALDIIVNHCPDILLLDIQMPSMDGIEVLKHISKLAVKPKIIILSAYNEFDYARDAMQYGAKDYILKPVRAKMISDKLESLILEIKNETAILISRAINYSIKKTLTDEIINNLREWFDKLNVVKYLFVDVVVCNPDGILPVMKERFDSLKYAYLFEYQTTLHDISFLIALNDAISSKDIYQEVLNALNEIKAKNGNLDFVIGFSKGSVVPKDLLELYNQAKDAVKMSFYSNSNIFNYSENFFSNSIQEPILQEIESGIIKSINANFNAQICLEYITKLFCYFRESRVLPELVFNSCRNMFIYIEKVLKYNQPEFIPGDNKIFLDELGDCNRIENLEMAFAQLLFSMLSNARGQVSKTDVEIIREIKHYVDKFYFEDLSLEAISAKYFINKYQISRIFKKEYGINYWDYTVKVRMEAAAFLILKTDLKTYEIAERVGYKENSYFSDVFKNYYGVRPKNYKDFLNGT